MNTVAHVVSLYQGRSWQLFSLTTSWSAWIPWMLVSQTCCMRRLRKIAPEKSSLRSFGVQLMSRLKLWPTNVFQQHSLHATQASAEYQLQRSATWQWPQSGWLQPRSFSHESSVSIAVCHHRQLPRMMHCSIAVDYILPTLSDTQESLVWFGLVTQSCP